jgi:hypothetical protein
MPYLKDGFLPAKLMARGPLVQFMNESSYGFKIRIAGKSKQFRLRTYYLQLEIKSPQLNAKKIGRIQ